jgi:hypothetical protein
MKCKICGHRTSGEKALPNMMKHYRKAHPQKLKERKAKKPSLKTGVFIPPSGDSLPGNDRHNTMVTFMEAGKHLVELGYKVKWTIE